MLLLYILILISVLLFYDIIIMFYILNEFYTIIIIHTMQYILYLYLYDAMYILVVLCVRAYERAGPGDTA